MFSVLSGSLSGRVEQHDHSNDKTGRNTSYVFGNFTNPSEQDFAITGPIFNRGKKKEVLLDDVGGSPSLKGSSNLGNGLPGGAKGKRSDREREKDISARKSVAKVSRLSLGNQKGDRKTKTKPKQKTAQLSTSGNGSISNDYPSATGFSEVVRNGGNRKREVGLLAHGNGLEDPSTENKEQMDFTNLQLHELDSIELGEVNEFGGNSDLGTWLNIDEDGLQEHDLMGLDIPMDDLSELNMHLWRRYTVYFPLLFDYGDKNDSAIVRGQPAGKVMALAHRHNVIMAILFVYLSEKVKTEINC